jgi:N-acetylmuramoyl-L-alanine amidase
MGIATWLTYSFDVKFEGKGVCRLSDKMLMNHMNTACLSGVIQPPVLEGGFVGVPFTNKNGITEKILSKTEQDWLEIQMLDEGGDGEGDLEYQLLKGEEVVDEGSLGRKGIIRISGIPSGSYKVTFPALDKAAWSDNVGSPSEEGRYHVALYNECVSSIAVKEGLYWEDVWNHPKNEQLREKRKNPNILKEKDRLFIPKKEMHYASGETGKRHTFTHKGVPLTIRIQIQELTRPIKNEKYTIRFEDHSKYEGTIDAEGYVEIPLRPHLKAGDMIIHTAEGDEEFPFTVGDVDPITTTSGVQQRLANLAYDCDVSGKMDETTRDAIARFQSEHDLEATGELDQKTRELLEKEHGA